MKDYFGMTQEQYRAWMMKHINDEPGCGLLACSPEIYAAMMEVNERYFKEMQDLPSEFRKVVDENFEELLLKDDPKK